MERIYFYCIYGDNTVLHTVGCSLGCLPELSNCNNNQPSKSYGLLRHHCFNVSQWISKWAESLPWGRFWEARGLIKQWGDRGKNNTEGTKTLNRWFSIVSHIVFGWKGFSAATFALKAKKLCWFISEVIYDCTSLKCLPIFRSFVKASKHIHHIELGTMACTDFKILKVNS